jgi:peptidoglycan/xylan/chitin deacetylase (PgdA/CDA1 family)
VPRQRQRKLTARWYFKNGMPALRLDRQLTLNFFQPLRRIISAKEKTSLPILMYHSISEETEENVPAYYRTATSPKSFAAQMALLRAQGYEVLGLRDGLEIFLRENSPARKLAVITFDDGFRDFFTAALPVLRQNNFGATVFLPTAFIGRERRGFKGRECMTWNEVRESQQAGIEFGSHTVNHPKLYELDLPQIRAELEQSKAAIENELGRPVRSFAYPYAFPSADAAFTKVFVASLKETGYDCNVTTKIGLAGKQDDPFTLKRLPINSADDDSLFLAKLSGAYDWLAWPQEFSKKIKGLVSRRRRN